jgi:hypothetical protein
LDNPKTTINLDSAGAFGLIQKIEVFDYLGSTVLESISEVPQLMALLLDLGIPGIDCETNGKAMGLGSGFASQNDINFSFNTTTFAPTAQEQIYRPECVLRKASAGNAIVAYLKGGSGDTAYAHYSAEFGIPLPSFLGFLSKKMVPLHNGFTILITLGNVQNAFFHSGRTLTTPSLVANTSDVWNLTAATNAGGVITYELSATSVGGTDLPQVGQEINVYSCVPTDYNVEYATIVEIDDTRRYVKVKAPWQTTVTVASPATTDGTMVTTSTVASISLMPQVAIETVGAYEMTVSNVFMDCQILELGPVAESMILSSTGGQPLVVHTKSFRSYVGNVLKTAQEFILNLNLNVASMTDILWMMRSKDQLEKINYQSIGCRTRNMLQRWFFQYGSTSLPQNNGIQTMGNTYPSNATTPRTKYFTTKNFNTEGYMELMKARPVDVQNSRIDLSDFNWEYKWGKKLISDAENTAGGAQFAELGTYLNYNSFGFPSIRNSLNTGKFAGGLNLELAPNKSGDLISGINTNGMNTSIRGVFHPLFTEYMDNCRIDAYAEYDAFINVSPGIATTVSF